MSERRQEEAESSRSQEDDWTNISDQAERRKVQNRLAQRKFREKSKQKREEDTRIAANQQAAGAAYAPPDPNDLDPNEDPSGLPWGSLSIKHVVETGRMREQESKRGSREPSASGADPMEGVEGAAGTESQGKGRAGPVAANIGLQLSSNWARGVPAWQVFRPESLARGRPPL